MHAQVRCRTLNQIQVGLSHLISLILINAWGHLLLHHHEENVYSCLVKPFSAVTANQVSDLDSQTSAQGYARAAEDPHLVFWEENINQATKWLSR
jgi:hypothetical protein